MKILSYFLENYDNIIVFDTETTGLSYRRDDVIEFACIHIKNKREIKAHDWLISLDRPIPQKIVELTSITDEMLASRGVDRHRLAEYIAGTLLSGERVLMIAHNVAFDVNFTRSYLRKEGFEVDWSRIDVLDTLTVFKDRHPFPHKLSNAISAYGLSDVAENSHRAIDDVKALLMVFEKMSEESDDIIKYINLIGYNPRYGIREQDRLPNAEYRPQSYDSTVKLYNCR